MLETPRERVELLRTGIPGKTIEEMYVKHNNLRLIKPPILPELAGMNNRMNNNQRNENDPVNPEAPAGYSGASVGDIVKFWVGSDIHQGEVRFIEKTSGEDILYIDSFSGWAYKVPEKRIVSQVPAKNNVYLTKRVELYRGEASVTPLQIHSG